MALTTAVPKFGGGRGSALLALMVAAVWSACGPSDPPAPWDTARMTRELMQEVQVADGFPSDFSQFEILGWRLTVPQAPAPPESGLPLPPPPDRVVFTGPAYEEVLLWARTQRAAMPDEWGWCALPVCRRDSVIAAWSREGHGVLNL